jgi:uncharacterized protein DUF6328
VKDERLDRELEEAAPGIAASRSQACSPVGVPARLPFNHRAAETDDLQRDVRFGARLLALGAVACFITPTVLPIRFREYDKERLVTTATRLAVVGLVFLRPRCLPLRSS